ncbi:response regulator [Anaeromyxobacter oryzae]|nr:response regulator [Anaeromyxobacter oryzae]
MRGRVLVVEDEPDIRESEAEVLESEGYEVSTAGDGVEALRRAHEAIPKVILLDLMMPTMDGWQFREAQLRDPDLAPIPVIVVSAIPPPTGVNPAAHITKPFDLTQLLDTVERVAATP